MPTNTINAPTGRVHHTAIWTGSEMIVWGGHYYDGTLTGSGGRYIPGTDAWTATSITEAPSARRGHTAVWTGSEMIVWGGYGYYGTVVIDLNDGGRYNPSTDSWVATTLGGAPTSRASHTAIWTGSEMIVWGGHNFPPMNTGGRYNPSTDSWVATSTIGAPTARENHTAVWTGTEIIVWGGDDYNTGNLLNTGGRYDPATDTWMATSTINAPNGRVFNAADAAVWTGSEMIVWGGDDGSGVVNSGGRYNPSTNSWVPTSTTGAPSARGSNTASWTGADMIVWGGNDGSGAMDSGGRYDPSADSWVATSTTGVPVGRWFHTAIWTGSEMIVWGGYDGPTYFDAGGRYCAAQLTPPPTIQVSGRVAYCSNPNPGLVSGVTLTVTGDETTSTQSSGSGTYVFAGLVSGGTYTVTPTKAARTPGSTGINTTDVIAIQRHFLGVALLSGCRLTAADVNGDSAVDTVDVIAVQRFYLGLSSGVANTGTYRFIPAVRSYSKVVSDQGDQIYEALILGDVAAGFVEP